MNVKQLQAECADMIAHGYGELPVIVKWDIDGLESITLDVAVATKQGMALRLYADPETERRFVGGSPDS